jgi:hypothetical protein
MLLCKPANEYHLLRPEPGQIAGRPLLDCSSCAPGEIPLISEETKCLGLQRYRRIVLPTTFTHILFARDNLHLPRSRVERYVDLQGVGEGVSREYR